MQTYWNRLRLLPLILGAVLLALSLSPAAIGADEKEATAPPFDPKNAVSAGLAMPTPYDKFIALDKVLGDKKVDWKQYYAKNHIDMSVDDITDTKVILPTLLGFRITDGVMAIKARDAELLNACATDIEAAAKKLGVADSDLTRAKAVRTAANQGEWMNVFMELGFLQQDIMKTLDKEENKSQGTLVIIGGWMQGLRYVASVMHDNYTPEVSNYLREPLLVKALLEKLQTLPDDVKKSPVGEKMDSALTEIGTIVNIKLDGTIPVEKIDRAKELATDVLHTATSAAK